MNKYITTIAEAINQLNHEEKNHFTIMMKHDSMSVEYFAPVNIDKQQPHTQDEVYVIASGQSEFYRDGEIINCNKGDIIFVPAGMDHRFQNFSDDFATWIIFYGEKKHISGHIL